MISILLDIGGHDANSRAVQKARRAVEAAFDRGGNIPRSSYEKIVSEQRANRRGLTLAGHVEHDPMRGFVLQTVDVAVTQRTAATLVSRMTDIMKNAGITPSSEYQLRLMMIVREDSPDVLALPGGMVPSPSVEAELGSTDELLQRDPIIATFRNEVREETGVEISVRLTGTRPERVGLDSVIKTSQLFAFGPGGGNRSDTTLGVVRDEKGQVPEAQVGEDAVAAGSVSVRDLLQYIANGGRLYGDKVSVDGRLVRGKHTVEVLFALDQLEMDLFAALNSATGYAADRTNLGHEAAIEDMRLDLQQLRELRPLRARIGEMDGVREAYGAKNLNKSTFVAQLTASVQQDFGARTAV